MSIFQQARKCAVVDLVSRRDRRFFDRHPSESLYVRRMIPGEFPPEALAATGTDAPEPHSFVLVAALAPSLRLRRPIGRVIGRPIDGRITLIFPDGDVLPDVVIVGLEAGR